MKSSSFDSDDRSTVQRVVSLLLAVGCAGEEVTLAQLTRTIGLPKPTVHRIAGNLVKQRLLEKTSRGYRLGILLFELGQHIPMWRDLRIRAVPFLLDIYESTKQPVMLGVLDGHEVLHLEVLGGHGSRIPPATGFRIPAHATAMGKVLLAHSRTAHERSSLNLHPVTPHTIVIPQLLERELEQVRADGVAFDREECLLGINCVAAPIMEGRSATCIGAVSVATPHAGNLTRLSLAIRTAASGISRSVARSERHPHATEMGMSSAPYRTRTRPDPPVQLGLPRASGS